MMREKRARNFHDGVENIVSLSLSHHIIQISITYEPLYTLN